MASFASLNLQHSSPEFEQHGFFVTKNPENLRLHGRIAISFSIAASADSLRDTR